MNNEEKEINLKQFSLFLLEKIVFIIALVILFGGILIGYNYHKQKNQTVDSVNRNIINAIISQNRAAQYAPENQPKAFTHEETPSNACISGAKLRVDYNCEEPIDLNDSGSYKIIEKHQYDIGLLLVNNDSLQNVIDKLNLNSYSDMNGITPDSLRWMITVDFDGYSVINVFVTDVNPERAKAINDSVINEFVSYSKNDGTVNNVEIIDAPSLPSSTSYISGISINNKEVIKACLMGAFVGALLSVIILFFVFVINEYVRDKKTMAEWGISVLGIISKNNKKREEDYKRIAYSISFMNDCNKIAYIPADRKTEQSFDIDIVRNYLKEIDKKKELVASKNILDNSDALLVANQSDIVIIGTTYGKTRMKDVVFSIEEIAKADSKFMGIIINDAIFS